MSNPTPDPLAGVHPNIADAIRPFSPGFGEDKSDKMAEDRVAAFKPLATMAEKSKPRVDTGGRAFPTQLGCDDGMTLRDWFAGKALMGLLATDLSGDVHGDTRELIGDYEQAAEVCYRYAAKFIAEKRRTEGGGT